MKLRLENLPITPRARILSASDDEVRLAVDGLVCNVCAGRVQAALARQPGVASAECSLDSGEAVVRFSDPEHQTDLVQAVELTVILPAARRWFTRLWNGARRAQT